MEPGLAGKLPASNFCLTREVYSRSLRNLFAGFCWKKPWEESKCAITLHIWPIVYGQSQPERRHSRNTGALAAELGVCSCIICTDKETGSFALEVKLSTMLIFVYLRNTTEGVISIFNDYRSERSRRKMKKKRTLLLWINATIYNNRLIDQEIYEKMERKIRSSIDKNGVGW